MYTNNLIPFASGIPKVKLINAFSRPYENAVATARTCYSSKIITCDDVSGNNELDLEKQIQKQDRRDAIAKSIYKAGHHTTLQHSHFQFSLENISRHFIWSFLHSHPYYNSEQVSQRYVEVKPGSFIVPHPNEVYEKTLERQMNDYHQLIELLKPIVSSEYYKIFPARKNNKKYDGDIKKKSQEVARYVLPIATSAFMYHTISGITLLRYWKICNVVETTLETRWVIGRMIEELMNFDPLFKTILEDPIPLEETPEWSWFLDFSYQNGKWKEEFDKILGSNTSVLVDWKQNTEKTLATSVREVVGIENSLLSDQEAIDVVMNPANNKFIGQSMNVLTLSKLSRCMVHPSYTFKKKLSHTADSQDQRHRMTPASRPILLQQMDDSPDYIVPEIIKLDNKINLLYKESMERSWDSFYKLNSTDEASYLLPNAVSIRFTESSDLLNLHHKMKMRLCYNAQEEIWRASLDEAMQINEIHPNIGKYLLPPCTLRKMGKLSPICPEGDRYCGVPVWRIDLKNYKRII
jgi:thymidylate synthase ThyX